MATNENQITHAVDIRLKALGFAKAEAWVSKPPTADEIIESAKKYEAFLLGGEA